MKRDGWKKFQGNETAENVALRMKIDFSRGIVIYFD